MRYAKVLLVVTRCATALAAFVPRSQHSEETSVLEVTLFSSTTGVAAELVATIKNTGATDLNLLKVGTLLDEALPVQKLSVADESGIIFTLLLLVNCPTSYLPWHVSNRLRLILILGVLRCSGIFQGHPHQHPT